MCKPLLFVCAALVVLHVPDQACAQFTDPGTYDNTPVGINQLELGYAYVQTSTLIKEPSTTRAILGCFTV